MSRERKINKIPPAVNCCRLVGAYYTITPSGIISQDRRLQNQFN